MKKMLTFWLALAFACAASAQRGQLAGTVSDASNGEPLVRAAVFQDGTSNGAFCNGAGEYTLSLPIGSHKVTFSQLGFQSVSVMVEIGEGRTTRMDMALEPTSLQGAEVVVSASRRAEKVTNAPATISIVNAKAISQLPSFNVAELLGRQRGLDYVRSGVLGIGVNARGFNSAFNPKNLQINDNRFSSLIATGLPLGALSTTVKEDIERIEVILGPSSALYGPNAHNGLINTITKDPRVYQALP